MKKSVFIALLFGAFIGLAAAPAIDAEAKIKAHLKIPTLNLGNMVFADNTDDAQKENATSTPSTPSTDISTSSVVDTPVIPTPISTEPAPAPTPVPTPKPVPTPTPEPVLIPVPVIISEPAPAPTPAPTPVSTPVPTKKPTTSTKVTTTTTATSTGTTSVPFGNVLGAATASTNIYNTSTRLPADLTRVLLEISLLLGAAGLVLAQERGLRTTLSRVWG